jgi:lipopolysaccharide biosynthesis glycosyltransferase
MRTYLTVITSDSYAIGAVALWESLRATSPNYSFVVVLTGRVSDRCERTLRAAGFETLRIDEHLERSNATSDVSHWKHTFSKLLMFDLVQFEKFVYLDADMLILRNLDHLFEKPHMSAAIPDKLMPEHENWVQLCSALMVIEPQRGLAKEIMQHVPAVERRMQSFSDQDLLHEHFPDWPSHPELELGQGYGVFIGSIDRYVNQLGYNLNVAAPDERTIAAVHFVGSRKPWAWSPIERKFKLTRHWLRGETVAVRMLREYFRLLNSARAILQSAA